LELAMASNGCCIRMLQVIDFWRTRSTSRHRAFAFFHFSPSHFLMHLKSFENENPMMP
jgi:hypothetical protein